MKFGGVNSLPYLQSVIEPLIHTVEDHLHHYSRPMGMAAAPTSDPLPDHFADFEGGLLFEATSCNNDWGTAIQILGADDTPIAPGMIKYDPGIIFISEANAINQIYLIRMISGESAAAGVEAFNYGTVEIVTSTGRFSGLPLDIGFKQMPSGTKLWAQIKTPDANAKTLSFSFELHEYDIDGYHP